MRVKIDQKYYCSECNRPIHSWEKICSNCGADASSRPNQKTKATKKDFVTGNLQKKQNLYFSKMFLDFGKIL